MKYTLTNTVHHLKTIITAPEGKLPFKAARQIWKVLCATRGCACGAGPLSEHLIIGEDGAEYAVAFTSARGEIAGFRLVRVQLSRDD